MIVTLVISISAAVNNALETEVLSFSRFFFSAKAGSLPFLPEYRGINWREASIYISVVEWKSFNTDMSYRCSFLGKYHPK